MKPPQPSKFIFEKYPEQRTFEDYATTIKKLISIHAQMSEIHSIYRFGSIAAPGISDIDYFIVTKGKNSFNYIYPGKLFTPREQYLFLHLPSAILPQRLFKSVPLLTPIFEKECIYGADLSRKYPQEPYTRDEAAVLLSDALFMHYPGAFLKKLWGKIIDVRGALAVAHGLKYPVLLFKQIGIIRNDWQQFLQDVERVREVWFDFYKKEQQRKVLALLYKGLYVSMDMIREYHQWHCDYVSKPQANEKGLYISRTHAVKFTASYNWEKALAEIEHWRLARKSYLAVLPISIAHQLKTYAGTGTLLGNHIRAGLHNNLTATKHNPELISVRIKRCEAESGFLEYTRAIGYRSGAFTPFHLDYLPRQGIVNYLRDISWKCFHKSYLLSVLDADGFKNR